MQHFDIVTIRIFLAIAREGSIGAAARKEHIAASAVSRRISELEKTLNISLISRTPSGVSLTPAGKTLARHCKTILERYAEARVDMDRFVQGEVGALRIAAVNSVICGKLPKKIARFQSEHPDVSVSLFEIPSSEGLRYLREDLADIVIIAENKANSTFETKLYSYDPIWVITPLDHPLLKGKNYGDPVRFEETLPYQYLTLNEGGVLDTLITQTKDKELLALSRRVNLTRVASLKQCVQASLGIGFLRESAALACIKEGGVLGAPLEDDWAMRKIQCVYLKPHYSSSLTLKFLDLLKKK